MAKNTVKYNLKNAHLRLYLTLLLAIIQTLHIKTANSARTA